MPKQITITIETNSVLVLQGRSTRLAWCPLCAAETETIALENAGMISELKSPALDEWLNSGALHRLQLAGGSELICLTSLLACVRKIKTG